MALGFEEIDRQEADGFTTITKILDSYSPDNQDDSKKQLEAINDQLAVLAKLHQARGDLIHAGFETIWVKQLASQEQLKQDKKTTLQFLTDEYRHFIEKTLDFDQMKEPISSIKSFVFKIMSRPYGQRLIVLLNKFNRENGSRIIVNPGDSLEVSLPKELENKGKCLDVEKAEYIKEENAWDQRLFRPSYKSYKAKGQPALKANLFFPKDLVERKLVLTAGTEKRLICCFPFVGFAHELIHVLHYFRGANRTQLKFRHSSVFSIFHLYDRCGLFFPGVEELWTIELAKLCENQIRKEHDLPWRGAHFAAEFGCARFDKRVNIISLLSDNRHQNKMLSETQIKQVLTWDMSSACRK